MSNIKWVYGILLCASLFVLGCGNRTDNVDEPAKENVAPQEQITDTSVPKESSSPEEKSTTPKEPTSVGEPSREAVYDAAEPTVETGESSPPEKQVSEPTPETLVESSPKETTASPKPWAIALGHGAHSIYGASIAVDSQQNVYITAKFDGRVTLGTQTFATQGDTDAFVCKLSPKGSLLWSVHLTGKGTKEPKSIVVDAHQNVYVTGSFYNTVTLGSTTFDATKGGGFLGRIDSSGQWSWGLQFGGQGADTGVALALGHQGNLYLAGEFGGPATFGSVSIKAKHWFDVFVAKVSPQGKFLWVKPGKGSTTSQIADLAVDSKGSVYVLGQYRYDLQLGQTTLTSKEVDMFVARYSAQGTLTWAVSTTGPGLILPYRIMLDENNSPYVTGEMEGDKALGKHAFKLPDHGDFFLSRMSPQGDFLWVKHNTGGTTHIHPSGLIASKGQLFVSGEYTGAPKLGTKTLPKADEFQAFTAGFNTQGSFSWTMTTQQKTKVTVRHSAVDQHNHLYLLGEFDTSATLGAFSLKPGDSQNYLFVWKQTLPN